MCVLEFSILNKINTEGNCMFENIDIKCAVWELEWRKEGEEVVVVGPFDCAARAGVTLTVSAFTFVSLSLRISE